MKPQASAALQSHYDRIYLSPHLDDVVLSCAGQIFSHTSGGNSVLIVTITAGDPQPGEYSPFARQLHQRWGLAADIVATRRREDAAACALLGADFLHWSVPDCIYRNHPGSAEPYYASEEAIFGPLHPSESALVARLARRLARLPAQNQLLIPLGAGNHVDHQLTRQAAEQIPALTQSAYYEDYPYVRDKRNLEKVLARETLLIPKTIPLTDLALSTKIKAIACYQSQINTFFHDESDMAQQISASASEVGGERLWMREA